MEEGAGWVDSCSFERVGRICVPVGDGSMEPALRWTCRRVGTDLMVGGGRFSGYKGGGALVLEERRHEWWPSWCKTVQERSEKNCEVERGELKLKDTCAGRLRTRKGGAGRDLTRKSIFLNRFVSDLLALSKKW